MDFPTKRRSGRVGLSALVLALASGCGGAFGQSGPDTLARIRSTRTIVLGVREAAQPFSFLGADKTPTGYTVELCLHAVEQIKRELKLPALKVDYKVVSGAERIPALRAGEIDLECGTTTNTLARQQQVAFSYTVFVASMRVLTPRALRIQTLKDLDGLPIAVSKGTTSEKLFTQLARGELHVQLQTFPGNAGAYQALKAGTVKAFAQDDSLLTGLVDTDKAQARFSLSELALSVEPYAIMARKEDTALLAIVDHSLAALYGSGEIDAIYAKWFSTEALSIKMGRMTRDSFVRPNKEPGVAMLLGYSI